MTSCPHGRGRTIRPYPADIPGLGDPTYPSGEGGCSAHCCAAAPTKARCGRWRCSRKATSTAGASGAYHTPVPIAALMADLLAEPGRAVPGDRLRPRLRGRRVLLAAASAAGRAQLYGQDLVPAAAAQAAAPPRREADGTKPG